MTPLRYIGFLCIALALVVASPAFAGEGFNFSPVGVIQFNTGCPNSTSDPNALDCYQEGTWTPSVGGTATYNSQVGQYTRIGNRVFISGALSINVIGSGSQLNVSGLPFPASNPGNSYCSVGYSTLAITVTYVTGMVGAGSSVISWRSSTVAAVSLAFNNIMTSSTIIEFTCHYQTP